MGFSFGDCVWGDSTGFGVFCGFNESIADEGFYRKMLLLAEEEIVEAFGKGLNSLQSWFPEAGFGVVDVLMIGCR